MALGFSFSLLSVLGLALTWLLAKGVGIWGVNVPVAWGFAIINFVWWIGIGHAGTLISAILLLLRPGVADVDQPLRRGDDALCGLLRRHLPDLPHRPSLAGLLDAAVPELDGALAAVPLAR